MNADSGMTYESSSNRASGGTQWHGCARGEPWKLVEILAMVLGFIVFWPIGLAVIGWKIWLSWRHRHIRAGKMESELGLRPVGLRGESVVKLWLCQQPDRQPRL